MKIKPQALDILSTSCVIAAMVFFGLCFGHALATVVEGIAQ